MVQDADLYSTLIFYANKNNSPNIAVDSFIDFLRRVAVKNAKQYPAWNKWLADREMKFWSEIAVLVENGKCEISSETGSSQIFLPIYYNSLLNNAYKNADDSADLPFPSEESLRITIPESQIKYVSTERDFFSVMGPSKEPSASILKINFTDDFGSALAPVNLVPRQLAEMAMLKIRNYLKRYGNREYAFHKLLVPLQGKESFLKQQLDQIIMRPLDTCNSLKESRELSYIFWAHFCSLVKNDIKKKQDPLPMDVAVYQAFFIIEAMNGHYRTIAIRQREKELAFKSLENNLAKTPNVYSMKEILEFKNDSGALLLNQYSKEELEAWLKKRITEREENKLPVLLIVKGPDKNEKYFMLKSKMLGFFVRLLSDARVVINEAISKQWAKLILEYGREPAMDSDDEFEKLLQKTGKKYCPELISLLEDPKLFLVHQETEKSQIPAAARVFNGDKLLPYSSLFFIRRKEMLMDAKYSVPFWYTMPIISNIVGFFKRLRREKKKYKSLMANEEGDEPEFSEGISSSAEIKAAAEELEFILVPSGYSIDTYLKELETRWDRLLDRYARQNLIDDVQYLVRDNLRRALRIQKHFKPTQEIISQMAENMITRNPGLSSINARESLFMYVQLLMVKLLENIK